MADHDDVRRIASHLPGSIEGSESFGFAVLVKGKEKGFLWTWSEKVHPKKAKVPSPGVIAVIVRNLEIKEILLGSDSPALFTEPHYNGYPAVLVRLDQIGLEELEDLVVEAWRCKAPLDVVSRFDGGG